MKTPKGSSGVKKTCGAILPLLGAGAGILALSALAQGQVTKYDIIMKQLLLQDFTVIQAILSAVVTGMIGIFALKKYRLL